jgi:hypothetical protein
MNVLKGRQAVMSIRIDGTFYATLCAVSVAFLFDHEDILKTTVNSGKYRERTTRLMDMSVQLTGLTKINNNDGQIGWFWLLQYAGTLQYARIRYTDDAGTIVNVYMWVLIKQGQLESVVGGFSTASINFPVSGGYTTDADPGITLPELYKLYLNGAEGAYEVSHADLAGATEIMLVLREDGGYKETTGTPAGRQFKYTDLTTSGKLTFDSTLPFNPPLEVVYVEYKKPA